jgi:hypothetical protein
LSKAPCSLITAFINTPGPLLMDRHILFYDSVKREVLYNILIEFGIPRKLVGLIKMCLNETCSRVGIGKSLTSLLFRMT